MEQRVILNEEDMRRLIRSVICEVLNETSACLGISYASVRHLAHDVKEGDLDAIDKASLLMKRYVPPGSILVPIPQHSGKAEYTLKMANRIAQLSKSKVCDVLSSPPRQNLYIQKMRGADPSKKNLGFTAWYDENIAKLMKSARNVILIDNAIDSGTTYNQAREAIRQSYNDDAWLLTLGAVVNPKDKSQDVIRSTYPKYGNGLYESIYVFPFDRE